MSAGSSPSPPPLSEGGQKTVIKRAPGATLDGRMGAGAVCLAAVPSSARAGPFFDGLGRWTPVLLVVRVIAVGRRGIVQRTVLHAHAQMLASLHAAGSSGTGMHLVDGTEHRRPAMALWGPLSAKYASRRAQCMGMVADAPAPATGRATSSCICIRGVHARMTLEVGSLFASVRYDYSVCPQVHDPSITLAAG